MAEPLDRRLRPAASSTSRPASGSVARREVEHAFAEVGAAARLGSAIQSPGQAAGNGSGSAQSWRKATRPGSSITPLSTPFSQWSKKRTISWCQSTFGPG